MMKKVKILGLGSVVQGLFSSTSIKEFELNVYARRQSKKLPLPSNIRILPMEDFCPDEHPTFLCCSSNEKAILAKSKGKYDRLSVLHHNLILVRELISKNFFDHGYYFILTNPSDLIAEFIFRKTGNTKVFGLGLSVDKRRYLDVFEKLGVRTLEDFDLGGNHWDRPIPTFRSDSALKVELLVRTNQTPEGLANLLPSLLSEQIKKEFNGLKPPVQSGVDAITDVLYALTFGKEVTVSGYSPSLSTFAGGSLDVRTLSFKPHLSEDPIVESSLAKTFLKTRVTLEHLMSSSRKVRSL